MCSHTSATGYVVNHQHRFVRSDILVADRRRLSLDAIVPHHFRVLLIGLRADGGDFLQ